MTTLTDQAILSGADNHPPMLEKDMYDSWKSIMELYMMNRKHGRMILESIENGPLVWPSIEENRVTRPKKYSELSATKVIQADCDVKKTNIILQGLPLEVYALAMPSSEQSNVVNHSETEINNDSNIIPYSQYVIESQLAAVQNSNSSTQQDALILSMIKQLKTQVVNCTKINLDNKSVNDTLTAELERYKEQEPTLSSRPTKLEVPKELPKVSMVNTSLKKLKHHLAGFDVVVKERTMTTTITEGSWGFEHTKVCFRDKIIKFVNALKDLFNTFDQYLVDELFEVQNIFHQMEQAME
nr:hypothetical protein [Tanacetum cinerariifolium]